MNSIKTSKFSVKGIDTTRYISSVARNLLFNRKGKLTPFELTPERQKSIFGWSWRRVSSPPPLIVILMSVVCEEESPQLILFGWSSRRVSTPPRYKEETPHCVRGDGRGSYIITKEKCTIRA